MKLLKIDTVKTKSLFMAHSSWGGPAGFRLNNVFLEISGPQWDILKQIANVLPEFSVYKHVIPLIKRKLK